MSDAERTRSNTDSHNIYADHAATTRLSDAAFDAMLSFLRDDYYNPSTLYSAAGKSKRAVERAREQIADTIMAKPNEIVFTSGGTESDNLALRGAKPCRLITGSIEHHAVLNTCASLAEVGAEIVYLPVSRYGVLDPEILENALIKGDNQSTLVSVMMANNEIGTVQDIKSLTEIAHKHGAIFHTDAVQAVGHLPINVDEMGVDMLSASAHKFNGPKGVGFLFVRDGVGIRPVQTGGAQEKGVRAGTENVAGIVGMATALNEHIEHQNAEIQYLMELEHRFSETLSDRLGCSVRYEHNFADNHLPGLLSYSFAGISGETILHRLDLRGIKIATGAACDSKEAQVSHVVKAIGVPEDMEAGTIRISFGMDNAPEDAMRVADELVKIVCSIARM